MRYTLPLPPSTNHIWRHTYRNGKLYVYLTAEARAWKEAAQWKMKKGKPTKEPVEVYIYYWLKYERDIDNGKLILDALQDTVVENDRQVRHLVQYKEIVKGDPCCEVEVNEL